MTKERRTKIVFQWALLVMLVGVLLVTVYIFVRNFETLRRGGYISGHIRRQPAVKEINSDQIRGWMTFRYINVVFNLPAVYLQSQLNIKDSRYPNLSLDSLARRQNINPAALVGKATAAVKSFHP